MDTGLTEHKHDLSTPMTQITVISVTEHMLLSDLSIQGPRLMLVQLLHSKHQGHTFKCKTGVHVYA